MRLAENASDARATLRSAARPDLVLLDIWMPDTDGITLLKEWASDGQLTMPVVMMSGHGTIDTAVEATRIGAIDFLEKPIALQKLLATVKRALRSEGGQAQAGLTLLSLGRSVVITELRKRLAQIAALSVPVLLRGEPGVMPELFARYLHQPNTPWVVAGAALAEAPQELLAQAASGLVFIEELAALTRAQQRNLALVLAKQEKHHTQGRLFHQRRTGAPDRRTRLRRGAARAPVGTVRCSSRRCASTPRTSPTSPASCWRSWSRPGTVRRGIFRLPRSTRCANSTGRTICSTCRQR